LATSRARSSDDVNARRWAILASLEQERKLTVRELSERFGLSEVSVRRDLDYLARHGLAERVRGGIRAASRSSGRGMVEARLLRHSQAKRAIAAEVARRIGPGESVLLDSGTTVLEVARALPASLREGGDLTVVTRSLFVASEVRSARKIRLIVLGGLYVSDLDSFVGIQVERALEGIHVGKLVLGADGVELERGLTTSNLSEVGLFRLMAQVADQVIVVADSSKFQAHHVQSILPLDSVDVLVTDDSAPPTAIGALRAHGVCVVVAEVPTTGSATTLLSSAP
jgi:DeoR/GlpR family transcriptional regulator of sugar metabolism